jgi:MFS transporter, DHA1 family, multidrug resistance protein
MYGFNLGQTGLAFVSVIITTIIGAGGYMLYQHRIVEPGIRAHGPPPLEDRLLLAIPASILMPFGLFIFAWTSRPSEHSVSSVSAYTPLGSTSCCNACWSMCLLW